ncbi:MAG: AroB-related putative sugar phosphate phospholyase (cyclizing) [Psychrobium sp.]
MNDLNIHSNIHPYKVSFEPDLKFINSLIELEHAVFVIDSKVYDAYQGAFDSINKERLMLIDAVEENKTYEYVSHLFEFLMVLKCKKNTHLISIGGGIIQDISGFTASTLYRGIHWTFIPTTLLAQADSCVGSKTSLNFGNFKNIVGSFYPPHQVHICSAFISSLSEHEINSGCGEIVKFMMLDDRFKPSVDFIAQIINQAIKSGDFLAAIEQSLGVKQSYIKQDEFDTGKRNLFNYGHCFGHALESSSDFRIPHGIAVVYGMIFANIVAHQRGLISQNQCNEWRTKLFDGLLSITPALSELDENKLINALKNDKKRVGEYLTMIIPSSDDVNAIKINNLTEQEVSTALSIFIQSVVTE